MKLLSKAALGIALATGSISMMAAMPAQAQKKKKDEAKGPQFELSKEFRAAMTPVDTAYKAQNWAGVLTAIDAGEAAATTPDEKYVLNQYRLDAATKANDPNNQAKAIDAMLATGKVPAADVAKFHFFSGKFAKDRNDLARAESELAQAVQGGFTGVDLYLTQAQTYSALKKYPQALAALDQAIKSEEAAGKKPPEDWYKFGFGQAYKGNMGPEVLKWTMMHVKAYPSAENWRTALVMYRDTQKLGSKVELDLYRLMLASKALAGEKDHYDYAYIANQAGLPGEAKVALDNLKTTGSISSAGVNDLYKEVSGKAAGDKASLAAEEKRAGAAANGVNAANIANAYLGYGEYAKAASLFQTALTKGGVDADEVNTRLGIAFAMSGQKDQAKASFAKVQAPARSGVAQLWTAWIDRPAA